MCQIIDIFSFCLYAPLFCNTDQFLRIFYFVVSVWISLMQCVADLTAMIGMCCRTACCKAQEVTSYNTVYCFVNGLLQNQLAKLYPNYPFMVVDNEAGMEHISRGILPGMDTAILVSDCSRRGVQAAARIAELIKECDMKPKQVGLIVNRAPNGVLNEGTREEIEKQGLTLLGVVPHDDQVYEYD